MSLTRETVMDRLRTVEDPTDGRDVVTAERVRHVAVCDGYVRIQLQDAGQDSTARQTLKTRAAAAVQELGDAVKQVIVEVQAPPPPQAQAGTPAAAPTTSPLPRVSHIIAVGAGKGGVGKSTVAVNLAVGLARRGRRVGLLDGDIYGPSTPTLLGLAGLAIEGTDQAIEPFSVHGIKTMTIGKMVDPAKPLIWRGPMAHGAFRQLALQTRWGDLDDLIIDLPPGTGDVPLTMSQMLPLDGAVIVCTPQKVAQDDAVRAAAMFEQLNVPVLGVVENMSYFIGDDGKEYDLFGRGGAKQMAAELGLPLLAGIPINMQLRVNSDAGDPTANFQEGSRLATDLDQLVDAVLEQIEIRSRLGAQARPTLSIS